MLKLFRISVYTYASVYDKLKQVADMLLQIEIVVYTNNVISSIVVSPGVLFL